MRKPLKLDRSKSFGVVSGFWSGDSDELDRGVAFEQDGRLYDSSGTEIIRGQPRKPPAPPPKPEVGPSGRPVPPDWQAIRSPSELIARHEDLSLSKLRQCAMAILGELGEQQDFPKRRDDILEALENAIRGGYIRAPSA